MLKTRTETWLALLVLAIGTIPIALAGLWGYMSVTAPPLHPIPRDIPSAAEPMRLPEWHDAVERGQQIVRAALTGQNLPGLSAAVGVDGEVVWAEGFGWANLERRAPVTPDTTFRIGTASTTLTSVAVGLLLEDGRLHVDNLIQKYVSEFPEKQWPVTLRQLMAHQAGVRNDGGDEGPLFPVHCDRPVEALPYLADRPLLFEPGTRVRYSSYGWILVSAAIEAVTKQRLLSFMRSHIFDPLDMRHTEADSAADGVPMGATPYFPRFSADPRYGPDLMRPIDLSCYSGSSAYVSTPSDLVRFGMAISSGTLLQPRTVQLLQTSQRLASGQESGVGLGWQADTIALLTGPARLVGHDGNVLGGRVASLVALPEHGIVVSVVSNISYADTAGVARSLSQIFAERGSRRVAK